MKVKRILKQLNVCDPALEWAEDKSPKEAWETCIRGDWLLWIAERLHVDEKKLFLTKALVAHRVIHLMKDSRSRNAVRAVFLYGRGKLSKKELDDAYAAAADATVIVTADAPTATATAAAVADENIYRIVRQESLLKSANICRKILTDEVFKKVGWRNETVGIKCRTLSTDNK